ncbi:hypothetical protein THAOC_00964, partial [Thalassiosira oceanica]
MRIFLSRKLTDVPSIAKMMNANTCHNNGLSAISSGKSSGKFGEIRYIRCAHGKAREQSKYRKGLESSSTRPDLDERCRCTPKERSELFKRDLSDDLVDDITEKLKRNIPKDVLRELVEYETGRTLSASVISHLKKTMVVDEFKGGDALEDAGDTVRVRKKVRRRRQCTSTTNCKGKVSAKSADSDNKGGTSSLDLTEDTGCSQECLGWMMWQTKSFAWREEKAKAGHRKKHSDLSELSTANTSFGEGNRETELMNDDETTPPSEMDLPSETVLPSSEQ